MNLFAAFRCFFHHKAKLICLFLAMLPTLVFATDGHFYLTGAAGSSTMQVGSFPNITYFFDIFTDGYPPNSRYESAASFGLSGGYEFVADQSDNTPAIAIGIGAYGAPADYSYHGQLIACPDCGIDAVHAANYSYTLSSSRLMAETQLSWVMFNRVTPFINFGIGTAWNHVGNYQEKSASPNIILLLPPFKSHTNKNFAFQAGLGIGYLFKFFKNENGYLDRVSLGYRYVGLGQTTFGVRNNFYPYRLEVGNLVANEFYLAYTHLF